MLAISVGPWESSVFRNMYPASAGKNCCSVLVVLSVYRTTTQVISICLFTLADCYKWMRVMNLGHPKKSGADSTIAERPKERTQDPRLVCSSYHDKPTDQKPIRKRTANGSNREGLPCVERVAGLEAMTRSQEESDCEAPANADGPAPKADYLVECEALLHTSCYEQAPVVDLQIMGCRLSTWLLS